ncbi:uncharacterized protein [Palaemon carinicauda]|uniref:uncharacterized protein n=1 Tax=Palaemon carinicauda TaxID=392227 RepID=UPI0035B5EE9A
MDPSKTSVLAGILILSTIFGAIRAYNTNPDFRSLNVKMVKDSKLFGTFLLVEDVFIHQDFALVSYLTDTFHDCRMMCWTYVGCLSLSFQPEGTSFRCTISKRGPLYYILRSSPGAKYIVLMSAFTPAPWRMLPDGVSMVMIPIRPGNFTKALGSCRRIPGFDLGKFNSDEIKSLQAIGVEAAAAVSGETGILCGWVNNAGDEDADHQIYYDPMTDETALDKYEKTCGPVCLARFV